MDYNYKDILSALKHEGYKLTPQRRAVIQALHSTYNHMTPLEIFEKVSIRSRNISLVTIYRTLDALEKAGFICRLNLETGRSGYLLRRPRSHHHHLVCSICGVVVNIGNCELEELEKRVSEHTGFKIIYHTLDISVICPECQNGKIKTSGVKI